MAAVVRRQALLHERQRLPVWAYRGELAKAIRESAVVIVAGATGSGKSTQVPQFILDDDDGRGQTPRVWVTQPRRVSAVSLAGRVAAERGERVGASVGYKIRLESQASERTQITYCTVGVLLRLLSGGILTRGDATHIIVDEVHERSLDSDFLLTLLKRLVVETRSRRHNEGAGGGAHRDPASRRLLAGRRCPKIVLMSATIDADRFSTFFGGAPVFRVEGRSFPVRLFYKDQVEELLNRGVSSQATGSRVQSDNDAAWGASRGSGWGAGRSRSRADRDNWRSGGRGGRKAEQTGWGGQKTKKTESSGWGAEISGWGGNKSGWGAENSAQNQTNGQGTHRAATFNQSTHDGGWGSVAAAAAPSSSSSDSKASWGTDSTWGSSVDARSSSTDPNAPPPDTDILLVAGVVEYIHFAKRGDGPENGAILVFVPGWADIRDITHALEAGRAGATLYVVPLHGSLTRAEQDRVFSRPPRGRRKVVVATNVAETSLTVQDVGYVVDTGLEKVNVWDAQGHSSALQLSWISRASAQQRRGRAGRVRSGECYRLYGKSTLSSEFAVPEILRSPLHDAVLQAKVLLGDAIDAVKFFSGAVTPPRPHKVAAAVRLLRRVRALAAQPSGRPDTLTTLGHMLAALPTNVFMAKLLVMGVAMGCLEPTLTLAAASSVKSLWLSLQRETKPLAKRSRALFGLEQCSDHMAAVNAYAAWERAHVEGGAVSAREFARSHALDERALSTVRRTRQQLRACLARAGLLSRRGVGSWANAYSGNAHLIRAIIASAHYPNIAHLVFPQGSNGRRSYGGRAGGRGRFARAMAPNRRGKDPFQYHVWASDEDRPQQRGKLAEPAWGSSGADVAELHTSSVLARSKVMPSPWLVYSEAVRLGRSSGARFQLRDASVVSPVAMVLFAGPATKSTARLEPMGWAGPRRKLCKLQLDEWISIAMDTETAHKLLGLRLLVERRVNDLLADARVRRVSSPDAKTREAVARVVRFVEREGFAGGADYNRNISLADALGDAPRLREGDPINCCYQATADDQQRPKAGSKRKKKPFVYQERG